MVWCDGKERGSDFEQKDEREDAQSPHARDDNQQTIPQVRSFQFLHHSLLSFFPPRPKNASKGYLFLLEEGARCSVCYGIGEATLITG